MATQIVSKPSAITAKERILKKAEELFYRQGYLATGINQIIKESGVAKATFYAHFPSKEDLCLAYVRNVSARELEMLRAEIAKKKSPREKILYFIESLEPWMRETEMKGCSFLNMIPEVTDCCSPIRKEGANTYKAWQTLIADLTRELIASDKKRYGHLKPEKVGQDYITIVAGAVSLAALHHDLAPIRHGVEMVKSLLK